jgi:hypothetical protein
MEQQAEEIEKLKGQLSNNSQNSSKPPSQRRYIQTRPKSRQALKPKAFKKGNLDIV